MSADKNVKVKQSSGMSDTMINKIAKAKRYAEEPERIQFRAFEVTFRGDKEICILKFDEGIWHCTCDVFQEAGDCQHVIAMSRILGITIPKKVHAEVMEKFPQEEHYLISSTVAIQDMRIRVNEVPLSPQNLIIIVSSITELYTKCWLIVRYRFADLIEYTQTHNRRFTDEANLVISNMKQNSPLNIDWKLDASPQGVIQAVGLAIDAIVQAPHRVKSTALDNQTKEITLKLKELEGHEDLANKEQIRQIAAQKAELEKQAILLEIEKQRLEVMAKRMEVEKMRIDYAFEIAGKMVDVLQPGSDEAVRIMLLQTLIPSLLQLGEGKGLELVLPIPLLDNDSEAPTI